MLTDPLRPLRFGILQVDRVRDELRPAYGDYPAMFERVLRDAAPDVPVRFEVYDVQAGEGPAALPCCDVYLITGSRDSVYDDRAWIRDLEGLVRELHQARHPLVGICFGHQLIAQALGGEVRPHDGGWAVGAHELRVKALRDWMSPAAERFTLLCSHRDQVTRLPEGAELLAGSAFCRVGAFAIDEHILAFQGHPEFAVPYSAALMALRRDTLGEDLVEAGLASLSRPIDAMLIARWIVNFALRERRPGSRARRTPQAQAATMEGMR